MNVAEILNLVTAVAALSAVVVATAELRHISRDRKAAAQAVLDGVAVEWRPRTNPNSAGADGMAKWEYVITAHNPGTLPIHDVSVCVQFPIAFRRLRFDGTVDRPEQALLLGQPVVLGGGSRTWRRVLIIDYAERARLYDTTAEISFTPTDGKRRTNQMGGR